MAHLATRFARHSAILRASTPLADDQIRRVAPSIFAADKHASRSPRYAYIPTAQVLAGLRREGFEPFMACQTRARDASQREYTKHMLRLRHASQASCAEAYEVILVNSHNGTSAYQMLAGLFREACTNGLVWGRETADIRVPHKGDVTDRVIEGAYIVMKGFGQVAESVDAMKGSVLAASEQAAFARAALALRYGEEASAPVTEAQVLQARRPEDSAADLWATFNRVQENMVQGGLPGRTAAGRRTTTRPVQAIDGNVRLNRALWVLAEEMRRLRGH